MQVAAATDNLRAGARLSGNDKGQPRTQMEIVMAALANPAAKLATRRTTSSRDVRIPPLGLAGTLQLSPDSNGLIVFAHGSGSSRFSSRNTAVADALNNSGHTTLLFDLLLPEEERDRRRVFDIPLLADRLIDVVQWIDRDKTLAGLPLILFGASTGAGAALVAAARLGDRISAVISRGGRPDLAGRALEAVRVPTLLIVGGNDDVVLELNEEALSRLNGPKALQIVPNATHLFPEPGALAKVIDFANDWLDRHLDYADDGPVAKAGS